MMKRKFRFTGTRDQDGHDFWMSYSDLMAGLLLVFILFMTVSILDYRSEMAAKEQSITKYQEELALKEQKIQEILGIKAQIIQELTDEFKSSNLNIMVDQQTGAITFDGGVFFAFNSDEITQNGYTTLNEFVPKYVGILLSKKYKPYVAQIIIEGHTDKQGTYMSNLELSQRRAFSVMKAILSDKVKNFPGKKDLETVATSNGRSFSQPVLVNGEYNADRSRRVEIKFRLKDDEFIKELLQMVRTK